MGIYDEGITTLLDVRKSIVNWSYACFLWSLGYTAIASISVSMFIIMVE